MPVNIHGKEYKTVAERIEEFHADKKSGSITTEIVKIEGNNIIVKATVCVDAKTYTGHGMEVIGTTGINKTSALENAETSAVGRALAFAGWAGCEIASADEVATAIKGQASAPIVTPVPTESYNDRINEENLRRDISNWLMAMYDGDIEQCKNILSEVTSFTNKEGKKISGIPATRDLKGKRLEIAHRKVKELYDNTMSEPAEVDLFADGAE